MGALEALDAKVKHLRRLEASYRQEIKWAREDTEREPEYRRRHERRIEKSERKIEKVMRKIRVLLERRERVRARLASRKA